MTPAEVALKLDDQVIEGWNEYAITSHLYTADTSFRLSLSAPGGLEISEGAHCRISVGEHLILTGLVDQVVESDTKNSHGITVTGRDLMGTVIDEYCTTFKTYEGWTVRAAAEKLLAPLPYISRKNIVFADGAESLSVARGYTQVEPGATVFETLRGIAASRGLLFYCRADGTLVFAKPKTGGASAFRLTRDVNDEGNNIKSGSRTRNLAARWRTVKVIGQQQSEVSFDSASDVNVSATVEDASHPLSHKTMVVGYNDDGTSAKRQADLILQRQRLEGFALQYQVQGHLFAGKPWAINELCEVVDKRRKPPVQGSYLIVGRSFSRSKIGGTTTSITLGDVRS
jgi:prophage tail gpP-like protein